MKDIVIIQRIFPQYRKPVFDAIHKQIDFKLLHSENQSGIKQTTSDYAVKIEKWQYGKGDTKLFLRVFKYIRQQKAKVVIHEMAVGILSLPLVLIRRKSFGYKLILWGHAYNRKIGFDPKKHLSDRYRLWLQKRADAIITYSSGEKQELIRHGIDPGKIFPALNTLDTNKYLPLRRGFEIEGKEKIKQKLGFTHRYNLIFIGRLYKDKWPQYAVEVLELLKGKGLSVALHFVGSGEMEAQLMEYTKRIGLEDYVIFHKEVYGEVQTGELLYASDMMIMPGCVGLSVNHAFCFDCPVITFATENNVPAHGPEIEYIVDGKTGFIVKGTDVKVMADILGNYLVDDDRGVEMKKHVRHMIENICPIEKLTSGFADAINYVNK